MKLERTPSEIATEIIMYREQHKGTFLILEGYSDARLFEWIVERNECEMIPAGGKNNALLALKILNDKCFSGVLAIIDADFWRLDGMDPEVENAFMTDTHDLETLILKSSDCLERHLGEFGNREKLYSSNGSVLEWLFICTRPVGLLRWHCLRKGEGGISLKKINYMSFVEGYPEGPNLKKMFQTILGQCVKKENRDGIDIDSLNSELQMLLEEDYDPWQVCNGHDMVQVFAIGLKHYFGESNAKIPHWETIEGLFRVAYRYEHFQQTNLYRDILKWQEENQPYTVLKS